MFMNPACRSAIVALFCSFTDLGAAEPALRREASPTAALRGHLGNPADGLPASLISMQGFVWTSGGVIYGRVSNFGYSRSGDQGRLCRWQIDSQKQRALLKDVLNVGGAWCAAPSGALLCAQFSRQEDEQNLPSYERLQLGALGCFKTSDGSRRWKLPLQPKEKFSAAAFTLDEKCVLVLSVREAQLSLRLLDAATGAEIRRHDFAGPAQDLGFHEGTLHMKQHEVWMRREGKTILRLPLATLTPEVVDCPEAEGQYGRMQVDPDGRRLAFVSGSHCIILERRKDRWETLFEDYSPMSQTGIAMDPFAGVIFHPKGLHAVVMQASGARVLQLPSAKVFSSMKGFFEAGVLSPDGRQLLQVNEAGMTILDLATLKPLGNEPRYQHSLPPDRLLFLPDNQTLASADAHGIWLWDLASQRPTARLQASGKYGRREALTRLAYVLGEKSIVGDEGSNLIRWRIPSSAATPPAIPLVVASDAAFGAKVAETGSRPVVFAGGPDGSTIVTHDYPSKDLILHQGLGPKATRTLTGAAADMLSSNRDVAALASDGKTFRYLEETIDKLVSVDLATGSVQKQRNYIQVARSPEPGGDVRPSSVVPEVILPDFQRMICKAGINYCLIDPSLDLPKPLWMEKLPSNFEEHFSKSSVSGDQKWLVAKLIKKEVNSEHMAVWNLTDGRLHALWQLPFGQCLDFALSNDGSLLACAHYNSSISLWEVAKLGINKAEPVPAAPPREAPSTSGAVVTHTLPRSANNRSEYPAGSGAWLFSEGGLASQAMLLPQAGRLRINEKEFTSKGWRLTPSFTLYQYHSGQMDFASVTSASTANARARLLREDSFSKISAGVISQSEGTAGNIWVTRQIGNPLSMGETFLTFTDTVVNLDFKPVRAVIEFEVSFPEASGRLMDSSFKPVEIAADGEVKLHPDAYWICPILKAGSPNPVPVFVFRSLSSARLPRLVWHATENRLVVFHDVDLPPAEARHVVHGLRMVTREATANPEIFQAPRWGDFSQSVPITVSNRGINFSISEEWVSEQPGSKRRYLSRKDSLGFEWNQNQDRSFQGSMGAAAVLQFWMDGAPLPFSGTSIFDCTELSEIAGNFGGYMRIQSTHGTHLSKSLQVSRQPQLSAGGSEGTILDRVFNSEKEPVTTTLTLLNAFTGPVKKMYAADGKPLPPGAPLTPEMCQGALILEFAGDQRPATIIAFHEPGAVLAPRISWPSLQMLRLDYEVTIPSLQSIYLWHAAAQRPLASFGSVSEAFTGYLPFKRAKPEKPQLGESNLK